MSSEKIKVGIVGATGFTGQELLKILFGHPEVQIAFLSSESCQGQSLNSDHIKVLVMLIYTQ